MEETKLSLSQTERALVTDAGIILTKNAVLQKVQRSLEALYGWQLDFVKQYPGLPEVLLAQNGKVSKGENYKGLPYLVLDYPRHFKKGHIFAVRTFFWWGRQLSTTLHLSGEWMDLFLPLLAAHLEQLKAGGFYFSNSGDEWEHDLKTGAYRLLSNREDKAELTGENGFIKIAAFAPVQQLEQAPELWRMAFQRLMECLY